MRSPLFSGAVLAAALVLAPLVPAAAAPVAPATASSAVGASVPLKGPKLVSYKNCTALKKVHPSGVAKAGVKHNTVSGKKRPIKGLPTFSTALYNKNKGLDRDKDGIACEKS